MLDFAELVINAQPLTAAVFFFFCMQATDVFVRYATLVRKCFQLQVCRHALATDVLVILLAVFERIHALHCATSRGANQYSIR